MDDIKLSKCLFSDLKTDAQRRDWFLLGRGVETGVIAPALQTPLANAYSKLVESNKLIEQLQQRITELEAQLSQLHEQQDSKAITMLFGLMGYLTSMEEPITFSAYHNATPGADIISRLIQANELKGDCDWDSYKPPKVQSK